MDKKLIALIIAAMAVFSIVVVAPGLASPPWVEDEDWSSPGVGVAQQDADGDGVPNCEDPDFEPLGDAYMWRWGQGSNGGQRYRNGGSGQKGHNGNCPKQ